MKGREFFHFDLKEGLKGGLTDSFKTPVIYAFYLCIIYSSSKGYKVLNYACEWGTINLNLSIEDIRKECLVCHNWHIKGLGVQPQGGAGLPI